MAPIVYLISGGSRGIGLALTTQLAERDHTMVFAGTRDPASAPQLQALAVKYPEKVHPIKLTAADKADNEAAVSKVKDVAGRLDVVIANAGLSTCYELASDIPLEAMREHYEVNVLGPLALFQAAWPLLKTSSSNAKFFIISSTSGSITLGTTFPFKSTAYGTSKAAANWLSAKLWNEYPNLVSLPLNPGPVETDMSAFLLAEEPHLASLPMMKPEESARGLLTVMDAAERTEEGSKFVDHDGTRLPW